MITYAIMMLDGHASGSTQYHLKLDMGTMLGGPTTIKILLDKKMGASILGFLTIWMIPKVRP